MRSVLFIIFKFQSSFFVKLYEPLFWFLGTMPCRTTISSQSWNKWWTRSQADTSAPEIQRFSETSLTCSSNMTGEKRADKVFTKKQISFTRSDGTSLKVLGFFCWVPAVTLVTYSSSLVSLQFQSVCRLWGLREMPRESQQAVSGNICLKQTAVFDFHFFQYDNPTSLQRVSLKPSNVTTTDQSDHQKKWLLIQHPLSS